MSILVESLYLPPIEYMAQLLSHDNIMVEQYSHYQKNSCRNRAYIGTSHGVLLLSIPLMKGKNGHQAMRDVRISYNWDWQKLHWQSLHTAYRSSPYFEFYEADFYPFYQHRYDFLLDFNLSFLDMLLGLLKLQKTITRTDGYMADYSTAIPSMVDWRHWAKPFIPPATDEDPTPAYHQVFADRVGFLPQLSIVDLLFNVGNGARGYLIGL